MRILQTNILGFSRQRSSRVTPHQLSRQLSTRTVSSNARLHQAAPQACSTTWPQSKEAVSRRRHVLATATADTAAAASGPSPAELQQQLAQKEAQLAAMFESGRPMPKASDVAQLRAEITALADKLAGRPVRQLPIGGHDAAMGAVAIQRAHARARSKTEELAYRAYELVEEQLRSNQGMGNSEDAEIAALEAENTQLRAKAYDLLQRQQQLETLLAEVRGAKPPELLIDTAEDLLARMKAKLQRS